MSPESFCYWLSGFFEISQHSGASKALNVEQVEEIKSHLKLVMNKVTPDISQEKVIQLPLFPNIQPITPPFNPGITDNGNTGRQSWTTYPQVSCCSGNVVSFEHSGD